MGMVKGMVNCVPVREEKQMRKGAFFKLGRAGSAIIICHFVGKEYMLLQVCLKCCNMRAKVKPDQGRYLAMIELLKTENLIRLPLYELIRLLL